jgi:hypothetical protein
VVSALVNRQASGTATQPTPAPPRTSSIVLKAALAVSGVVLYGFVL